MRWSIAVLVLGLFLAGGGGQQAAASSGQLAVSLDGRHWTGTIKQPLFSGERRWVPGDESTVSFWIRNDSGELAALTIAVSDTRGTLRLGRDLLLSATVDGQVTAVDDRLVSEPSVNGRPRQIRLTARFPASAGNETQRRSAGFWLEVRLNGEVGDDVGPAGWGSWGLAATGGPRLGLQIGLLGAVLATAGAVVTLRARRSRL